MKSPGILLLGAIGALLLSGCTTSGSCSDDASVCGGSATCNMSTGQCEANGAGNCVASPALCGSGTVCDAATKTCKPGTSDCRVDATVCDTGATCDMATGHCTGGGDCTKNAALCGAGTSCNAMTGHCDPAPDCKTSKACGTGTVCNADGTCGADCRADLLDTCGTDRLCNQANGVCDSLAPGLDCNKVASICWEKQVCDKSGYCAEAAVDTELDYDVELYDLTIDVDTKLDMFSATEKVFFKASKAGTKSIDLDIGVPASGWTPYMVSSVKDHAGKDVAFTQDDANGKLKLPLSATLAVGDSEVLTIQYTGAVNPITDENDPLFLSGLMHRPGADGQTSVVQTYGWPNNARRWIPSHDHPSDASRAIITVGLNDATMEPLANGVPVQDSMANGFHRRTFLLRQPVPAYALFVGAAAFHHEQMGVVDGVAIDTYMYEQDKSVPLNYWTGLLGEMHYLSQRFGQYPFERFAVLEIPDPLGGMEHATVVDVADWWIESDASSSQDGSIHEMIHHWWGDNARQRSWGEFWLNESMASYFTIDVYGAQTGPTAYQASMDLQKFYLFRSPVYYSDDTLHYQSATDDVPGQTTYASLNAPYVKGPWVWHMLRDSLGEDMFWKVVKAFYDASRFQKYDTALLLKTINQVSGKDYTQFFNEWVEQRGWPVMTSSFSYDAQKKEVTVTANQVQDAAWGTYTFTGPTALEFDLDDADPNTPTCQVMVSFTNGALTATAKSACAYTPTEMSMPFTSRFLIQPQ